jgi:surface antigen
MQAQLSGEASASPSVISSAPVFLAPEPDQISDERTIAAVQHALGQLGYPAGVADGAMGPATHMAILAFQKDHELTEDGRLTQTVANLIDTLAAQVPRTNSTTVAAGDVLLFADGSKEIAKAERVVPWDMEGRGGLVAIRPSTTGWPPMARARLDWATSRALDAAGGSPIAWSSTGVDRHFEILATPVLSPWEMASAAAIAQSCRHFELRETQRRYPGIACRDANGEWYFLHSRIRLAHPVRKPGARIGSAVTPPGR